MRRHLLTRHAAILISAEVDGQRYRDPTICRMQDARCEQAFTATESELVASVYSYVSTPFVFLRHHSRSRCQIRLLASDPGVADTRSRGGAGSASFLTLSALFPVRVLFLFR